MSQTRLPDTGVGHCTLDLHGHDSQESTGSPKVEHSAQVANPCISSNSRHDQNYETQMRRRGHVTGKMLRDNFHLPLHTVAKKFGMCTTAFKKLCRRFEIPKWPHRQLRGIDKKIAALKAELNYSSSGDRDQFLAGLTSLEIEKARLAQGAIGAHDDSESEGEGSRSASVKDDDDDEATPPPPSHGAGADGADSDSDEGSGADADEAHPAAGHAVEFVGAGMTMTQKDLQRQFHLPLHTVAKRFGICTTALKKLCRRFGIAKWPHRQLRGIDKKIAALKAELNYSTVDKESARQYLAKLEEEKAKLSQGAEWTGLGQDLECETRCGNWGGVHRERADDEDDKREDEACRRGGGAQKKRAPLIWNKKQETPLIGRRVVINGLGAKPELNGCTGTAVSFDDDKGRYSVELDDSSSLMIKPCNLLDACMRSTHASSSTCAQDESSCGRVGIRNLCNAEEEEEEEDGGDGTSEDDALAKNLGAVLLPAGGVTEEILVEHLHLPLMMVAKKFGMCTTALKKLCRRFGIAKWPHRQLRGIDKKIAALKAELNYSTVDKESALRNLVALEEEKARLSRVALGQAPGARVHASEAACGATSGTGVCAGGREHGHAAPHRHPNTLPASMLAHTVSRKRRAEADETEANNKCAKRADTQTHTHTHTHNETYNDTSPLSALDVLARACTSSLGAMGPAMPVSHAPVSHALDTGLAAVGSLPSRSVTSQCPSDMSSLLQPVLFSSNIASALGGLGRQRAPVQLTSLGQDTAAACTATGLSWCALNGLSSLSGSHARADACGSRAMSAMSTPSLHPLSPILVGGQQDMARREAEGGAVTGWVTGRPKVSPLLSSAAADRLAAHACMGSTIWGAQLASGAQGRADAASLRHQMPVSLSSLSILASLVGAQQQQKHAGSTG